MVCLDLHTKGYCEKDCPQNGLGQPSLPVIPSLKRTLVCEYYTGQNPREKGYGLHLCIVSDLNDLQIIGTECHCNGSGYCHNLAHSH